VSLKYAAGCLVLSIASSASAQPASPRADDPLDLFQRGAELARASKCNEALPLLERSFSLQPSPNSLLMVSRCLRDVDRVEDAWVRYGATIEMAGQEITAGRFRYEATRSVATAEREALGKRMATVTVHVKGADDATQLVVGAFRAPLPARAPASGDSASPERVAELHVRAAARALTVRRGDGAQIEQRLALDPTQPTEVSISFPSPTTAPGARKTDASGSLAPSLREEPPTSSVGQAGQGPWKALGIAGLGVGVLGTATFVYFKLRSESIYNELSDCKPCSPDHRDRADLGARDQTIANVGLVVGIVGLAAGTGFLIYSSRKPSRGAALEMGPSSMRFKFHFQ